MAQCAYCKTETELYFANVPVCIRCADQRSPEEARTALTKNLADASSRANAACEAFEKVVGDIPSATPHPDGVQRIKNASQELKKARHEMMQAHRTLDDYTKGGSKSNRKDDSAA
jgi:hypothetical protein